MSHGDYRFGGGCARCSHVGGHDEGDDGVLTVPDVAEWMHVSEKTVYRLVRRGELEAFKVGAAVRIRRSAVLVYMSEARMGGAA